MAKKKAAAKKNSVPQPVAPQLGEKSRLELRLDTPLVEQLKRLADQNGISVNQLMQGVARWAVEKLQPGEPVRNADGHVTIREQSGCLWAGRPGRYKTLSEEEYFRMYGDDGWMSEEDRTIPDISEYGKGEVYLFLDFTERRVVREDF
ncbi:hypothetical protein [Planctomicrobium sp. SH527]|uniref:hypothetical protein n=1 Tax=Planctomicrobium sp. SH527 TaxID=3448123 RepID=UPI003F5C0EB4